MLLDYLAKISYQAVVGGSGCVSTWAWFQNGICYPWGTLILQTIGDGSRVCNSKASSFSCQPTVVYHTGELCQKEEETAREQQPMGEHGRELCGRGCYTPDVPERARGCVGSSALPNPTKRIIH